MVEGDRFGTGRKDTGPCDPLLEVEVLVRSQAYIEAALRDNQSAIEDCAMNHQGRVPGEVSRSTAISAGIRIDQPACRTDNARAAIRDFRARYRFEFASILATNQVDRVVGIKKEQPAASRCSDAAVTGRRYACRGTVMEQQREPRVAREIGLGDLPRAVGRSVIDYDRLPVRANLGHQAVECSCERFCRVQADSRRTASSFRSPHRCLHADPRDVVVPQVREADLTNPLAPAAWACRRRQAVTRSFRCKAATAPAGRRPAAGGRGRC